MSHVFSLSDLSARTVRIHCSVTANFVVAFATRTTAKQTKTDRIQPNQNQFFTILSAFCKYVIVCVVMSVSLSLSYTSKMSSINVLLLSIGVAHAFILIQSIVYHVHRYICLHSNPTPKWIHISQIYSHAFSHSFSTYKPSSGTMDIFKSRS